MTVSLLLGIWHFGEGFSVHRVAKRLQAAVLIFWILAPPIWFWYELWFLDWDKEKTVAGQKIAATKLETFKYQQDQSAKIWLALVTVLLAMYFGKDFVRQ